MTIARPDNALSTAPGFNWAQFEPGLRRYLRRRANSAVVDDLLQEVWVRLCSMRDPSSIVDMERYLFVVAASVLSRHQRRSRSETGLDQLSEAALPVDEMSPERLLSGRERMQQILSTIDGLPAMTRRIFLLHRFEEMTYKRIALELGVSVSSVEKHMIKALKALIAADGDPQ